MGTVKHSYMLSKSCLKSPELSCFVACLHSNSCCWYCSSTVVGIEQLSQILPSHDLIGGGKLLETKRCFRGMPVPQNPSLFSPFLSLFFSPRIPGQHSANLQTTFACTGTRYLSHLLTLVPQPHSFHLSLLSGLPRCQQDCATSN